MSMASPAAMSFSTRITLPSQVQPQTSSSTPTSPTEADFEIYSYRSPRAMERWLGEAKRQEYWHHLGTLGARNEAFVSGHSRPKL